jgi:hypothetical protein
MRVQLRRVDVFGWALAALCAGLLAVIGVELYSGFGNVQAQGVTVAARVKAPLTPLPKVVINFPPLAEFAEVVERPLFDVSRRPPPEPEPEPETPVQFNQLELEGIVKTADGSLAIIYDKRQRQTLRLEQGAKLGPWALMEIRADGITFGKGTATHEMLLHPQSEQQPRPGAAPAQGAKTR